MQQSKIIINSFRINIQRKLVTILVFLFLVVINYSCREKSAGEKKQTAPGTVTSNNNNESSIITGRSLLQDGDLVARSDDDFESLSLQNFSQKDRTYSHSGIAFNEDSTWYIYHSMAGPENPAASIRREAFESFVNPLKKTGFGIFRYRLSREEITDLHLLYKKNYAEKMPFDKGFNLATDDSMYCSEIIYKSLKKVTNNRVVLPTSVLTNFKPKNNSIHFKDVFYKRFEYVGLDDLYINPFCKKIFAVQFN